MRTAKCGALLTAGTLLFAACGDDEAATPTRSNAPQLASVVVIDGNPYAIACGHVRAQQKWADATRRATVALSDREQIRGLTRLQATQSLCCAMTELCKGRPASYNPAKAAVSAVREGKYRADLGAP